MKAPTRIAGLFAFFALALIANPRDSLGQNSIYLRGVVEAHCSIVVSALPAASDLPLTATGLRWIHVGTILRNCNQKTGFSLTAASATCTTVRGGAKVFKTVLQGALSYSVESDKPASSAASVTDLLAASCPAAVRSSVASERGADGMSTLYVTFDML